MYAFWLLNWCMSSPRRGRKRKEVATFEHVLFIFHWFLKVTFPGVAILQMRKLRLREVVTYWRLISLYTIGKGSQPVPAYACPLSLWPSMHCCSRPPLTHWAPSPIPPSVKAERLICHCCHEASGIFQKQRFLILKKSSVSIFFSFMDYAFVLYLRILCLTQGDKDFLLCFILEGLWV